MAGSEIRTTIAAIEKTAERVIKRIGFEIQGELIRTTPVDTGWARANWLVSIGRPTGGATPKSGEPGKGNADTSLRTEGQQRMLVYRLSQGDIWLGNHVPYISVLNAGHSKQAPKNFVELAIRKGIATIAGGLRS
jgi:hypothetical protein